MRKFRAEVEVGEMIPKKYLRQMNEVLARGGVFTAELFTQRETEEPDAVLTVLVPRVKKLRLSFEVDLNVVTSTICVHRNINVVGLRGDGLEQISIFYKSISIKHLHSHVNTVEM